MFPKISKVQAKGNIASRIGIGVWTFVGLLSQGGLGSLDEKRNGFRSFVFKQMLDQFQD